jgi:hypothetical protein
MKQNILILLCGSLLLFNIGCNNNNANRSSIDTDVYSSEDENNELKEDGYKDGTYCAEVEYYNPSTGTRNIYDLDVEVEGGELTEIHWPNGGWLDDTHFYPVDITDGECEFTSDRDYRYTVTLGEFGGCGYTDEYEIRRDVNDDVEATTCTKCGGEKDSYDDYCYSCKRKIEDEEENTCSRCGSYEYGVYGGLCSSCKRDDEENENDDNKNN